MKGFDTVARHKGKATGSKPITSHQLFPAVVALWFGALFGLGSLAVRPTLLESVVMKTKIDLLIPAAAPPLGLTARLLVALSLAAFGAMLGMVFSRYIARPRVEVRQRKRATLSTRDEGVNLRQRDAHPDAPARRPISVNEELGGGNLDQQAPGLLASRRRALAIEEERGEFVPRESAPLPGGPPQIFNASTIYVEPALDSHRVRDHSQVGAFARIEESSQGTPATVALDWTNANPFTPAGHVVRTPNLQMPDTIARQHQVTSQDEPANLDLATEADDRQVFGMAPPVTPVEDKPRQIFGEAISDDHVPKEFVEAHGFRTSVFDTPEPSPLFAPRTAAAAPSAAPIPVACTPPQAAQIADAGPAIPQAYEPEASTAPEPVEPAPLDLAVAAMVQAGEPVVQPALASPSSLDMDGLAARLAESMRRRRDARSGPSGQVAPAVPVSAAPIEQVGVATTPAAAEPEFAEPVVLPAFEASNAAPGIPAPEPALPPSIPSALRPLDLGGFEEDEGEQLASALPPRWIGQAQPAPQAVSQPVLQPQTFAPPVPQAFEPEVIDDAAESEQDEAIPETNYGSLLEVVATAAPRNPFVRVEEPEIEASAVEPVVIFPGQAPFARQPEAAAEEASFRRFDAPSAAGSGQPTAAGDANPAVAPDEAERVLRAALANLQRMSGAA